MKTIVGLNVVAIITFFFAVLVKKEHGYFFFPFQTYVIITPGTCKHVWMCAQYLYFNFFDVIDQLKQLFTVVSLHLVFGSEMVAKPKQKPIRPCDFVGPGLQISEIYILFGQ